MPGEGVRSPSREVFREEVGQPLVRDGLGLTMETSQASGLFWLSSPTFLLCELNLPRRYWGWGWGWGCAKAPAGT